VWRLIIHTFVFIADNTGDYFTYYFRLLVLQL